VNIQVRFAAVREREKIEAQRPKLTVHILNTSSWTIQGNTAMETNPNIAEQHCQILMSTLGALSEASKHVRLYIGCT
jgi:hypothetical protein